MIRKYLPAIAAFLLLVFTSCVSRPQFSVEDEALLYPVSSYVPDSFEWQEVCPGISRFDYKNSGFPIIYHVVKIDLTLAGLSLSCFPDKGGAQPFIFRGLKTKNFAKKYDCTVAVNLSPFAGKNGAWDLAAKLGTSRQIVGVHVADGLMISTPVERYAAIYFKNEVDDVGQNYWLASIEKNQSEKAASESDYAFGGFYVVLENGEVIDSFRRNHDTRTGFGISDAGKTLFIMVAEGENTSKSEGLSYPQCAVIFKALGCTDALEMDGGGSSELCINRKSILSYKNLRTQANSLGFSVKTPGDLN